MPQDCHRLECPYLICYSNGNPKKKGLVFVKPIATQLCVEYSQEITWTGKKTVEYRHNLELFEDKVTIRQKSYPLKNVFDMSFRQATKKIGFLYLHTSNGVVSLYVESKPTLLLDSFRKLKMTKPE
ncbi:hypothetical protein [Bacillus alkalicellulosilyticus]|uniref:hypothetical protein n=1 Tax=Alkalihalobacterium alkalicellulosilyticum TaxID=1912214 RepID=UPI000996DFBD|nr:hypothetical protein [Bacillus alkalicellulosilyticus]